MLTISSKAGYGVAALFELALAYGKGSTPVDEIARSQGIPSNFLRQMLLTLKKARLVESVRGTQGGYVLAKRPSDITVREILESLDGPIRLIGNRAADQALHSYWTGRQKEIERIFDGTLEDLIEEKQRRGKNIVYHI